MPPPLFAPLRFLENEIFAKVDLGPDGKPRLTFDRKHAPDRIRQAQAIAKRFDRLLALQLAHGRASVQKLLAQGKIELRGGRYVVPKDSPS